MMPVCDTYYGSFRTRTFADIFESAENFKEMYNAVEFPKAFMEENTITTVFYLLYARYGNSHIAYTDENQFVYAVFSNIFMYGPAWEKRLEIQDKLRNLTEDEITRGGKAIYNHAYNPGTQPSTSTLEELEAINDQNVTNYKKSKMEAYGTLWELITTDVTEAFVGKFKKLFLNVVAYDTPLVYKTYEEN